MVAIGRHPPYSFSPHLDINMCYKICEHNLRLMISQFAMGIGPNTQFKYN